MEFTIDEINDIYWAVKSYADLIRKTGPIGSKRLYDLSDKIWKQLTEEEKKKIHPERKVLESWTI